MSRLSRRRRASVSVLSVLLLVLTGLVGVVGLAGPAAAVTPKFESVTPSPAKLVFADNDAKLFQATTVRMTLDPADAYRIFDFAYVTDASCDTFLNSTCPRYEIADAPPVKVGNVDVIRLFGEVPNTHANGTLVRSDRAGASGAQGGRRLPVGGRWPGHHQHHRPERCEDLPGVQC